MMYADTKCRVNEIFTNGRHDYVFTGPCKITHKDHIVVVPANELYAYRQGEYIQKAMKSVSADDREFLMTGYSPEGWKQIMGDEEDDYEVSMECEDCNDDFEPGNYNE